ncbi:hypothetical protein K227x_45340 [Rubripirellula lacrimiformis]|uniref:Uncharacterized protein n=1 Tax=Rubripirellula lacrimiformis TaxID=1930273 RepID=A0A517NG61_9BACT|nr:hypothetical protein K227x_45340 [Rubripirellula lacrimiformis]
MGWVWGWGIPGRLRVAAHLIGELADRCGVIESLDDFRYQEGHHRTNLAERVDGLGLGRTSNGIGEPLAVRPRAAGRGWGWARGIPGRLRVAAHSVGELADWCGIIESLDDFRYEKGCQRRNVAERDDGLGLGRTSNGNGERWP